MGEVHVWYMTEEERLEYIRKHPIVPYEKPAGSSFADINTATDKAKKRKHPRKGKGAINHVDLDRLHELFMRGVLLADIAKALSISEANLNNVIKIQRKVNPEKWPHRK